MHLNFSVGRNKTFMWKLVIEQKYVLGDCSKGTNLGLIDKRNVANEATDCSGQALAPHLCPVHEHPSAEQQPGSGAAFPARQVFGFWMWPAVCPCTGTLLFKDLFLSYSIIFDLLFF